MFTNCKTVYSSAKYGLRTFVKKNINKIKFKNMDNFYDNQKKASTTDKLIYIGVSAVVVFGLVYLVGRAWKKSQTA